MVSPTKPSSSYLSHLHHFVVGSVAGLVSHNKKFYFMKDGVNMAVKQGAANMTRKASGTEKKKLAKGERMVSMAEAENLATTYEQLPGLADDLPGLAAEYIGLNQEIAAANSRKEEISATVKVIHSTADVPMITGDFFVTEMVTSHRPRKLDPKLLLEAGVDIETIEACYTGGDDYQYLQIRARAEAH